MINDTIVALSTPHITSALGIIRMSGDKSFDILEKIFSKKIPSFNNRTILVGDIIDDNKDIIDNVVVSLFKNPTSFTGEDTVEISCHGGLLTIDRIISLIISKGARQAEHGEFSKKAYYNGKIDLLQAESINDLIMSKSALSSKMALNGLRGDLSKKINYLKEKLTSLLAQLEVNIDYPEYEDIEQLNNEIIFPIINELEKNIDKLIKDSRNGLIIKDGVKIALIGKPNAGKSSLLNELLQEDKAIVTDIPGTTRDVVEGHLTINDIPFIILDTAGIRDPKDYVEKLGVERSKQAIINADIVILVIDGSEPINAQKECFNTFYVDNKPCIVVINKIDTDKEHIDGIEISCLEHNIEDLKNELVKTVGLEIEDLNDIAYLSNTRQIGLIKKAKSCLDKAVEEIKEETPIDLVYIDIKEALDSINDVIGANSREDLDNEIFAKFCIGK